MYYIYAYNLNEDRKHLIYAPNSVKDGYVLTSCKLTIEVDKGGKLKFTIPFSHPKYSIFKKISTMISVFRDEHCIWFGRVFGIRRDFYKNKTITCEGAISFLEDISLMPYKYLERATTDIFSGSTYKCDEGEFVYKGNWSSKTAYERENTIDVVSYNGVLYECVSSHTSGTSFDNTSWKKLYVTKNVDKIGHLNYISDLYNYRCHPDRKINISLASFDIGLHKSIKGASSYTTILNEIKNAIIGDYCLYMNSSFSEDKETGKIRTNIVIGNMPFGKSNQTIEFGKNLIDFEEYISAEDIYSSVIPVGEGDMSIFNDNDEEDSIVPLKDRAYYIPTGVESGCGVIDKVVNFGNINDREELYDAGVTLLSLGGGTTTSEFSIKAVDLHLLDVNTEAIDVGDSVRVISRPHEIDTDFVCRSADIDLLAPGSSEYTFCIPEKMSPLTMTEHMYDSEFKMLNKVNRKLNLDQSYGVLKIHQNSTVLSLVLPKGE